MKPKRDLKSLERRRLKAGRLLAKGISQAEVARRVGASRQSVWRWAARLAEGELKALARGKLGRPAALGNAERKRLAQALLKGALSHGYPTELWTLPRIGKLIRSLFDVSYSQTQVWRILKEIGFSSQRPTGRATQRNEQAIGQWKTKRWPVLKKTPEDKGEPSFSSTSPD